LHRHTSTSCSPAQSHVQSVSLPSNPTSSCGEDYYHQVPGERDPLSALSAPACALGLKNKVQNEVTWPDHRCASAGDMARGFRLFRATAWPSEHSVDKGTWRVKEVRYGT
jgi:hypothetical protein